MGRRLPIAGAYTAGWRAGHRAARTMDLDLTRRYAEADIEQLAADEARGYMEDMMERRASLRPRDGVHLFFFYFDGYRDGVLLGAARRTERTERTERGGHAARRDSEGVV
ncbi:MAG: hypothetical protein IVW57_16390, partial [Ktedonobacterales bacterium]|nr:hypothetical protein [Ktedonobacterales bacterium]